MTLRLRLLSVLAVIAVLLTAVPVNAGPGTVSSAKNGFPSVEDLYDELKRPLKPVENKALAIAQSSDQFKQFRASLPKGYKIESKALSNQAVGDESKVEVNFMAFSDGRDAGQWLRMAVDVSEKAVLGAYVTRIARDGEGLEYTAMTLDGKVFKHAKVDGRGNTTEEKVSASEVDFNIPSLLCSVVFGSVCWVQTILVVWVSVVVYCQVNDPMNPPSAPPSTVSCVSLMTEVVQSVFQLVCITVPSLVCSWSSLDPLPRAASTDPFLRTGSRGLLFLPVAGKM